MSPADPYVYPGTDVLRNKFNIRDAHELSEREANITALAAAQLAVRPVRGDYDLAHLQEIHARLFQDIYPWAGQLRTVAIAKGSMFCLPQHIESYAGDIFRQLHREQLLRGRSLDDFVDAAAGYLADINALHPFRDGNGRTQRAFISQLAQEAGNTISWSKVSAEANRAASIASFNGDNQPLADMLRVITRSAGSGGPHPAQGRGQWASAKPAGQVLDEAAQAAAGLSDMPRVEQGPEAGPDAGIGS